MFKLQVFLLLLANLISEGICRINDPRLAEKFEKNGFAVSYLSDDRHFPHMSRFYRDETLEQKKSPELSWSHIVIIIFIYDSEKCDDQMKQQFDTWLKRVGTGMDIVFVTDIDDTRTEENILPQRNATKATTHIYRSPAKKDGHRLRFKVIDGFQHVQKLFESKGKKFFIKADTDTYVLPENLFTFLEGLEDSYRGNQPVMFGRAVCHNGQLEACYGAGPLYGFNEQGFRSVNRYLRHHPEIISEYQDHPKLHNNIMIHEDTMMGHVYKRATGFPIIHNERIRVGIKHNKDKEYSLANPKDISYHRVPDFSLADQILYDRNRKINYARSP